MLQSGYVICPTDISIDKYIETCFKTETISFVTDLGARVYHDVKIDPWILQRIDFPDSERKEINGSLIIFSYEENTYAPIILGVLARNDQINFSFPHQQRLFKSKGDNFASLIVDGKKGQTIINVNGDDESEIVIRATSPEQNSKIILESNNEVFVRSTNKVHIQSKAIVLGNQNYEPAVLGNTLIEEILSPLIDAITQLTVPTAMGPSGVPINNPQFSEIQNKLDIILSKINTLQ